MSLAPAATPIRVALVGLGWAARSIWLPRLREHPSFTVTAAVDPDPVARAQAAAAVDGLTTHGTADLLSRDHVDLAVVAVPNHLHASVAGQLLVNGIPVFLEKPVCLTSAEADRLAAAELAGGAVLLAGSAARYRADVRELHRLTVDLGSIRHIDLGWVRARGVPDAGGWFTQRQLAGGGALVDLGWHLLDAVAPFLESGVFEQAIGTISDDFVNDATRRAGWRREDPTGGPAAAHGNVEDTARGFLVTGDGVSIALRASWASHEPRDVTSIRVEGSAGTATLRCTFGFSPNRLDASTLTLTRNGVSVPVRVPAEAVGAEYRQQLDALPALLADAGSRGRAIEEARNTIGAIERVYASAGRGSTPRPMVSAYGNR